MRYFFVWFSLLAIILGLETLLLGVWDMQLDWFGFTQALVAATACTIIIARKE